MIEDFCKHKNFTGIIPSNNKQKNQIPLVTVSSTLGSGNKQLAEIVSSKQTMAAYPLCITIY